MSVLSPAATGFLEQLRNAGFKPFHQMTVEEARAGMAGLFSMMGPGPSGVVSTPLRIATPGGPLEARLLAPPGPPRALLVYLHGGGWVLGTIGDYDGIAREIAARTRSAVLLVDYRLAPEHRFPAQGDDAWAALTWAADQVGTIVPAGTPLVVAGDSAGGALATALAQRARNEAGPTIAAQILLCPVLQADPGRFPSQHDPACQIVIGTPDMAWFWDHYAPDETTRNSPEASPLLCADLAGLPPALILTAEFDVNRDEAEAYSAALQAAGGTVRCERFAGEFHDFPVFAVLPSSTEAIERIDDFLTGLHKK